MRKVKPKELSLESFSKYGRFAKIINPDGPSVGPKIHEFFRDQLVFSYASAFPVGISVSHIQDRPRIISVTEIHRDTGELLLPLTGDIYCHVGMCSGHSDPDYSTFEIFRVPKGTAIMVYNGVWHHAGFPCGKDDVDVMVLLPERTYANDCIVIQIPSESQIEIDA
jgi:ureidoglycolate lyase